VSTITQALSALATRLSAVTAVRTGWDALETTSATLPVITIRSLGDAPAEDQSYDGNSYTRRLGIEYLCSVNASADYQRTLDTALGDLRAAIVPDVDGQWLSGYALAVRPPTADFIHPADNGGIAVVQLILEIDYLE
jgi:hypothetical protein